eukprot:14379808-Alexandrium_andersonii.AAC.1
MCIRDREFAPASGATPAGLALFSDAKGADDAARPRVGRGRRGARGGNPSGRLVSHAGTKGHHVGATLWPA